MVNTEIEQETDGRWIAEVPSLSGVMSYGETRELAIERVQALSLRVIADRLEHGEPVDVRAPFRFSASFGAIDR